MNFSCHFVLPVSGGAPSAYPGNTKYVCTCDAREAASRLLCTLKQAFPGLQELPPSQAAQSRSGELLVAFSTRASSAVLGRQASAGLGPCTWLHPLSTWHWEVFAFGMEGGERK
jgi:hypothetical protein